MKLTIGIYKLVGTIDPETERIEEVITNNCGDLVSSSVFDIADTDTFEKDVAFRLVYTIVFERIELLRIYDEYLDRSQSVTFKRDILDNFKDGMTIATLSWK